MKQQAYDFFQKALTAKLLAVIHKLDSINPESDQYDHYVREQIRLQNLLVSLDAIANTV